MTPGTERRWLNRPVARSLTHGIHQAPCKRVRSCTENTLACELSSRQQIIIFSTVLLHASGERSFDFDTIIRNGTIYDGSGGAPFKADVGIKADRIAAVGVLSGASAGNVIEARGLAVAPGFINMLSWSTASLIVDGRSQSEIRQGVTTEIFGEGQSMGPLTEEMKRRTVSAQGDLKFDIAWTSLCEYLSYLEKRGISPNVGSFVGAGTVRENVIGLENKKADPGSNRADV